LINGWNLQTYNVVNIYWYHRICFWDSSRMLNSVRKIEESNTLRLRIIYSISKKSCQSVCRGDPGGDQRFDYTVFTLAHWREGMGTQFTLSYIYSKLFMFSTKDMLNEMRGFAFQGIEGLMQPNGFAYSSISWVPPFPRVTKLFHDLPAASLFVIRHSNSDDRSSWLGTAVLTHPQFLILRGMSSSPLLDGRQPSYDV